MPGRHSAKQKRQAKHIADSERKRGQSAEDAERIGWATVNARNSERSSRSTRSSKAGKAMDPGGAYAAMGKGLRKASTLTRHGSQWRLTGPDHGHMHFKTRTAAVGHARTNGWHYGQVNEIKDPAAAAEFHQRSEAAFRESRGLKSENPSMGKPSRDIDKAGETALTGPEGRGSRGGRMATLHVGAVKRNDPKVFGRDINRQGIPSVRSKPKAIKSFRVLSIGDYYDTLVEKAAVGGAAPSHVVNPVKKFPRKEKPTVRMKPISDAEAAANLRAGKFIERSEKSRRLLIALKALATGYSKGSGGGALKAPNRGHSPRATRTELDRPVDLERAMSVMPKPSGPAKPPSYLPGVHNPKSPMRPKMGIGKKPGKADVDSDVGKKQKLKKNNITRTPVALAASLRPSTSSKDSPRALDGGGATELSNSIRNVVHKSEGAEMKTNFNDLFKSELGTSGEEVLCDCPHCDAPITKSDLVSKARGHRGKGKTTHLTGPKTADESHIVDQNPDGGTMRGGEGRGVHSSSRGVPGAKKHDDAVGVQNSKGSHTRKSDNDESSSDESSSDDASSDDKSSGKMKMAYSRTEQDKRHGAEPVKKSVTIRGTDWVQYVDDGTDAAIAKSIAEGALGGTQPTQPLDLNNDLTRLLI